MKTNVPIELSDEERVKLADVIDGKHSLKMATRAQIVAICQQHIGGLVGMINDPFERDRTRFLTTNIKPGTGFDIYKADPADVPMMAKPNDPGYVRGWNLVKRGNQS